MAKTIRFNLQFGNYEQPIRNIEELRENFNVDLIVESFQNGLLQRWLKAQNEEELLSKISEIPSGIENNFADIERLCKIFMPELSRKEIESAAYPFEFRKREEKRLISYIEAKLKKEIIIEDYYKGYACLLAQMVENSENYQFLKTATVEITDNYRYLFTLNIVDFYYYMVFDYRLVILSLLGNQYARKLLTDRIGLEKIYDDVTFIEKRTNSFINRWKNNIAQPHLVKCNTEEEKQKINESEVYLLNTTDKVNPTLSKSELSKLKPPFEYIPTKLFNVPKNAVFVNKTTNDYWSDNLIPEGKKCLVLRLDESTPPNFINDKPRDDGMLAAGDVKNKFPILDGLFYKSKNEKTALVYMEL
jgi:hypothetical protein